MQKLFTFGPSYLNGFSSPSIYIYFFQYLLWSELKEEGGAPAAETCSVSEILCVYLHL